MVGCGICDYAGKIRTGSGDDGQYFSVMDSQLAAIRESGETGRLYSHAFLRRDGRQILFLWDKDSSPALSVRLPRPGSSAIEIRIDGGRERYSSFDRRVLKALRLAPGMVRIFEILP